MTTQKNLNSCVRQALPDSKCICAWLPSCLNDYENFLFLAFGRGERKRKNKKRDRESKIEMLWDWECKHQANAFAKKTNCVMKEATMKVWEKKKLTERESLLKAVLQLCVEDQTVGDIQVWVICPSSILKTTRQGLYCPTSTKQRLLLVHGVNKIGHFIQRQIYSTSQWMGFWFP